MAGSGEKLADEIFRVLAETGDGVGWEALKNATFYVHEREWKAIAYLLAVAYGIEERSQDEWDMSMSSRRKRRILYRFLRDVTRAARGIRNEWDARQVLEEYLLMPMGLHMMPNGIGEATSDDMRVVIR